MRQIGMLVAVELDSVLRRYGSPENAEELGGFRVFNYRMDGYELHVINSGVGELAAAAATQPQIFAGTRLRRKIPRMGTRIRYMEVIKPDFPTVV